MVQGSKKLAGRPGAITKSSSSAKINKQILNSKKVKKGNPLQLPTKHFRNEALDDHALSKAIDKSNERKVAAKLIQGGGKLATTDLLQKGKELNKDLRRSQVKKKVGRVGEKLKILQEKAEREGLV
jgi:hypothetical protein